MNIVAVGLIRTSTNEQSLGLEAQRASIEALCDREGLQLADVVVADGISGMYGLEQRPDLHMVLETLQRLSGGVLVVAEGSRIARNPLTALTVEDKLKRMGCRILSAKGEGYGSTSATDIFSSRVLMAQRELEANLTRERTRAALAALKVKKAGRYAYGRPPYGFEVIHGELHPKPGQWEQVYAWIASYNAGMTQTQLAKESGKKQPFISRIVRTYKTVEGFIDYTRRTTIQALYAS